MSEPLVEVIEIFAPRRGVVEVVGRVDATVEVLAGLQGPLGPQGPAGPPGEPGDSGDAQGAFHHEQTDPQAVWTIEHGLGFNPAGIVVTSSDGYTLDGYGVQYLIPGLSLRLSFDISVAGVADLS